MLNRLSVVLLALTFACPVVTAQGPGWTPPTNVTWEYGSSIDLKGARRVFLDTGYDMRMRTNAIKIIHKDIPDLEIVNTPDVADVLVLFIVESSTTQAIVATTTSTGSTAGSTSTTQTVVGPQAQIDVVYDGFVIKPVTTDRWRLLMSYGPDGNGFSAGQLAATAPYGGSVVAAFNRRGTPAERFTKTFARQFVKAWKEANPGYKKPKK